jgi:hypothetical protein
VGLAQETQGGRKAHSSKVFGVEYGEDASADACFNSISGLIVKGFVHHSYAFG